MHLANRVYKKNIKNSTFSHSKKEVSRNKSNVSPFDQQEKRNAKSEEEYKLKNIKRREKSIIKNKNKIQLILLELVDLPQEKINIILLSKGINPKEPQSNLYKSIFNLYIKDASFLDYIRNINENSLNEKDFEEIKNNITNFEIEELCFYLDINPELNFFKKSQLVNELLNKIKLELYEDFTVETQQIIDLKDFAAFSKDLYVNVYGEEDINFLKKQGYDINTFFMDFTSQNDKNIKKFKSIFKSINDSKSSDETRDKKSVKNSNANYVKSDKKNTSKEELNELKKNLKDKLRELPSFRLNEILNEFNLSESGITRSKINRLFNNLEINEIEQALNRKLEEQNNINSEKTKKRDIKNSKGKKGKKKSASHYKIETKIYGDKEKAEKLKKKSIKDKNLRNSKISKSPDNVAKKEVIRKKAAKKMQNIDYDNVNKFIDKNLNDIIYLNDLVLNSHEIYLSKSIREDLLNKYSDVYEELNQIRLLGQPISIFKISSKNCDLSRFKCDLNVLKNFNKIYNDLSTYMGLEENYVNKNGQLINQKNNTIRIANENYIQNELEKNKPFFDDLFESSTNNSSSIKKVSLDNYQRRAVVIDEDNTQIIAGAGTGKTLTLQAKLKYLTKVKGVEEENILCLSFSRASVEDLKEKIYDTLGENEIDIRTFHSLGANILRYNDEDDRIYKGALNEVIENYFKENIIKDNEKIREIIKFFSYYFYVPISELECKILDEDSKEYKEKGKFQINKENKNKLSYGEKLKKENSFILETFKDKVNDFLRGFDDQDRFKEFRKSYGGDNEKITVKRERVRSLEELVIANYLYLNGIKYEYESKYAIEERYKENIMNKLSEMFFVRENDYIPLKIKKEFIYKLNENLLNAFNLRITYHPDFYLPDYDIWIEHYGVNKDCEAPWLSRKDSKNYSDLIKWKRNLHKIFGTKLIETYSYYTDERRLLKRLEEKLKDHSVIFKEVDYKELYEILIVNGKIKEYNYFIELIKRFINLFKSNGFNIDQEGNDCAHEKFEEFREKNLLCKDSFIRERNEIFLNLVETIYNEYQNHINRMHKIDFNDMINDAVKLLRNDGELNNYEYILVDEYQDTSYTRYNLIKAIQEKIQYNGVIPKIIVVGDDWQSIYKFTGCNIKLFTEFDEYFDSPECVKIQKTYRNSQALLDTTGAFIQKNKDQIRKTLESDDKDRKNPIKIINYESKCEMVLGLEDTLLRILADYDGSKIDDLSFDKRENFIKGFDKEKLEDLKILLLGRNNSDIDEFLTNDLFSKKGNLKEDGFLDIFYNSNENINIKFRTVHKSKGLEADYVVLLNLKDKMAGFPNQIEEDEIIDFFFKEYDENIEFAEERRLFYVALTRTRNDVFLLSPKSKRSNFIEDLMNIRKNIKHIELIDIEATEEECERLNLKENEMVESHTTDHSCPICKTGKITLVIDNRPENFINNEPKKFFNCSNNTCTWYGGSFNGSVDELKYIKKCKNCDGVLYVKDGRIKPFLGCTKYYKNHCSGDDLKPKEEREIVKKWFKEGKEFKSKYKYDPKTFRIKRKYARNYK